MTYRNKSVFVTGAGGQIGSALVEELVNRGAHVRALCRYTSHAGIGRLADLPPDILAQVKIIYGDVRDAGQMKKMMRFHKIGPDCDYVFHLAALIGIPYSYEAPASYIDTNLHGTMNILEAARELNIGRVVITSTSEVYGTARYVPIDESHPLQAQSPYSASKIAADKLAESYHLTFGVPVTIVRPFNTYGPRQSTRAVIPTIISQLLDPTATVLRLGSLTPMRDMLYVDDTVSGFLTLAASEKTVGRVINLGTGIMTSIGDIAEMAMKVVGRRLPIQTDDARVRPDGSEVRCLLADATLALSLDWEPKVNLEEGLKRVVEYLRQNPIRRNDYAI